MRSISKATLLQPSSIVFLYLTALCFTFVFVERPGQSTLIDELFLLAILPLGLLGLYRSYFYIGAPAKLIIVYFIFAAISSSVILTTRADIPFAAPIYGMLLDIKFIIFLGALLHLSKYRKRNNEEIIIHICKIIILIALANSAFFLRDIFLGGTSVAGIILSKSPIYGYVPIGLFSHKLYTAAINSLALISAITLYLSGKGTRFLWASILFINFLLLSSSAKELGVLIAILFMAAISVARNNQVAIGSRKLFLIGFFAAPILAFIFGAELERLFTDRINVYLLDANTRAALHIKSAEIATDYFPLGSGAGTFSSQPSRSLYFSPLYYEYGMTFYYGATENFSSFLMDAGWPKFIAEAGWIGGGAYFLAYLITLLGLLLSFLKNPNPINTFGVLLGALIFSSALGSSIFTGDIGLMICALLFFCQSLE